MAVLVTAIHVVAGCLVRIVFCDVPTTVICSQITGMPVTSTGMTEGAKLNLAPTR